MQYDFNLLEQAPLDKSSCFECPTLKEKCCPSSVLPTNICSNCNQNDLIKNYILLDESF